MKPRPFTIFAIVISALAAVLAVLLGIYVGVQANRPVPTQVTATQDLGHPEVVTTATPPPSSLPSPSPSPSPTPITITSLIDNIIPFTSQAPSGQWEDPVFQDGCEEASILMAMDWVNSTSHADPAIATQAIHDISQFEADTYGEYRDRSATDTAQLIRDYFKYDNISVKTDVTINDLKAELAAGNVIVAPMNGRALPNQHYTAPGPERHMLLIRGYDPVAKQFITNDPGTKFGEAFRFNEQDFFGAIRDYHTGYHIPITSVKKTIIVIRPR